jgi:hypothetical protein
MTGRNEHGAPQPLQAKVSRRMADAGLRLQRQPGKELRPYFCRSCGVEVNAYFVPAGWFSLTRHTGELEPPLRIGLFCSIFCLKEQLPRISGVSVKLGDRWITATHPLRAHKDPEYRHPNVAQERGVGERAELK